MADEETTSNEESTVEPGGASQETPPETQQGESTEFDITKIPAEKLASHPEFQRQLQSLKDKEAARIERSYRERQKSLADQRRREAEEADFDALLDSEDYDSLGRKTAESRVEQRKMADAARMVSGVIEDVLKQRPEFRDLGEDAIESIYERVKDDKGTVVDFMVALSSEAGDRRVKKETDVIRKSLQEEVDAMRAELGLTSRSKDSDDGNAPSGAVSRATGATGMTPEKYLSLDPEAFDALPNEVHQRMTAELSKRR
jgi:hypothetical protein